MSRFRARLNAEVRTMQTSRTLYVGFSALNEPEQTLLKASELEEETLDARGPMQLRELNVVPSSWHRKMCSTSIQQSSSRRNSIIASLGLWDGERKTLIPRAMDMLGIRG